MRSLPAEIIKKKRNHQALSEEEIIDFVQGFLQGDVADYQMAAFLMAVYFNSMTELETLALTKAYIASGQSLTFPHSPLKVDKHSTGGVGDKTSLILAPIVACAGVDVPMMAGRGLGHTGGTIDKLESIPGFRTDLSLKEFVNQVTQHHLCFIGQTADLCPADKRIYALRDVTATVESIPLICASIMSKKLAEGIDGIVLDIKYGNGAFMKTYGEARLLSEKLLSIANGFKKKARVLITDMSQPMGRYAGNSNEILECLEILDGKTSISKSGRDLYQDTRELSLRLAGHMIFIGNKANSDEHGYEIAQKILTSGEAAKKFRDIVTLQGGNLSGLVCQAPFKQVILADRDGYIAGFDTEMLGYGCVELGAGRKTVSDKIDPVAGLEFHKKISDPIKKDEAIVTLFASREDLLAKAVARLKTCVTISLQKPTSPSLIREIIS